MSALLSVSATVEAPIVTVWDYWNKPEHIVNWFCTQDSRAILGTEFLKKIDYKCADGRGVSVRFDGVNGYTVVTETVDFGESSPTHEQEDGLQSHLDSFKKYAEASFICC